MRNIVFYTAALFILLQVAACKSGGLSAEEKARVAALETVPRMNYKSGGVEFSLGQIDGMRQVHKDSVPWAQYLQESEDNGQLGYYFFPGYARELAAPQVRLEYMSKSLKGCSTVDSLFIWLKGLYVTPERKGKVANEEVLGSLGGDEIKVLEIETPKFVVDDSVSYSEKYMAWAYADLGPQFVGFSYSAITKDDYNQGLPLFKDLIRSYRVNK
jgi:hypothetical protein